MEKLLQAYTNQQKDIRKRLSEFKALPEEKYLLEHLFCILTPQSNAKKCWDAVCLLPLCKNPAKKDIAAVLEKKTRFHNNKARYIIEALKNWDNVKKHLNNPNRVELRNWLAENIRGYGLKEASHFLRNIGKSDNQIAILDRHILRNLKALEVIKNDKIRSRKEYLLIEKKFISFSRNVGIPIDELDLLFWSKETGEIFK